MNRHSLILLVTLLAASMTAHAHPGHHPINARPSHMLLTPDHCGAVLMAAVILFCFVRALRWRNRSRASTS